LAPLPAPTATLQDLSVPQRWFLHFYAVGTAAAVAVLLLLALVLHVDKAGEAGPWERDGGDGGGSSGGFGGWGWDSELSFALGASNARAAQHGQSGSGGDFQGWIPNTGAAAVGIHAAFGSPEVKSGVVL
jgi:hypothetical protein